MNCQLVTPNECSHRILLRKGIQRVATDFLKELSSLLRFCGLSLSHQDQVKKPLSDGTTIPRSIDDYTRFRLIWQPVATQSPTFAPTLEATDPLYSKLLVN